MLLNFPNFQSDHKLINKIVQPDVRMAGRGVGEDNGGEVR